LAIAGRNEGQSFLGVDYLPSASVDLFELEVLVEFRVDRLGPVGFEVINPLV
jgi:hypothetical protein